MAKSDISALSISELYFYAQATKNICTRYENSIKVYDGSIRTDGDDYEKYDKFNRIYLKILDEIEKRVSAL